jgi:uncharacterized protein (TIGR02598 family)
MKKDAFSLIEVNMALLVVSLGLAALLGLFPVALRESGLATSDTTQALFATRVLNAIQANAGTLNTWTDWRTESKFIDDIDIDGKALKAGGAKQTIENANGVSGSTLCYTLSIGYVVGTDDRLRYAAIRTANNPYSNITNNPVYYTEFRYGCN